MLPYIQGVVDKLLNSCVKPFKEHGFQKELFLLKKLGPKYFLHQLEH